MLEYIYTDNMAEKRMPHRQAHLDHANAFVQSQALIAGGALLPEVDKGYLIFRVGNAQEVEDFVRADPYVRAGLVSSWRIREWAVAIGSI